MIVIIQSNLPAKFLEEVNNVIRAGFNDFLDYLTYMFIPVIEINPLPKVELLPICHQYLTELNVAVKRPANLNLPVRSLRSLRTLYLSFWHLLTFHCIFLRQNDKIHFCIAYLQISTIIKFVDIYLFDSNGLLSVDEL